MVDDFADVGVGFVIPDSLAATVLKLKTGDQILSLNGKKMTSVPELRAEIRKILQGTERIVTFTVLGKNGKSREHSYSLPTDNETRRSLIFGFYPKSLPRVKIADVTSGSEAETQGIKPNETLKKVNGLAVSNSAEAVTKIRALVQDHSETKIRLTVADEKGKARDVFVNLP